MNTDACNEEDINIPISQSVCRCLLSHSLKIVFAFFALDHSAYSRMIGIFNDISDVCDGVRIHLLINKKSIRVLCEYNRSPCSIFNQFIRFPLLRRPNFINIPFWAAWWESVHNGSSRSMMLLSSRAQRKLTFMSGFPRSFCVGFTSVKNTVCLSLLEFVLPLLILNLWWSANWLHIQYDKSTRWNCS